MEFEKELIFSVFQELDEIFELLKEYLIIDQWIRESTRIYYIILFSGEYGKMWYCSKITGTENDYSCDEVEIKYGEKPKEVMVNFLNAIHGRGKYLSHKCQLGQIDDNIQLLCICETPIIENNIGKLLFLNAFAGIIDDLNDWFKKVEINYNERKKEAKSEHYAIVNKEEYVSKTLIWTNFQTKQMLETLYNPINLSYINGISGEYYERTECNSTLVFLPLSINKKIISKVLEFNLAKEEIGFEPKEYRRIRKIMQIAQKELCLLFEFDEGETMYKVLGICKKEKINEIFGANEKQRAAGQIPWANATFKKHMQWELRLGEQYIFSSINGNYKISAEISKSYLEEKCVQMFGGKNRDYQKVINYIKESCNQAHGTMLVILSKENAKSEAERFTCNNFGMQNSKETSESSELDINAFNSIDGSVLLDQTGTVHSIGVILDGVIENSGNMARGARYNSSIKYLDYLRRKGIPGMILIVSEDGSVEIMDTLK